MIGGIAFPNAAFITGTIARISGRKRTQTRRREQLALNYIHHRADLTGFHRDQVICHELGHILADHVDQPSASAPARLGSLSLLAGDAARHMFARACVAGDDREDEAEYIASLILQRARETNTGPVARGLAAALD